MLRRDVLEIGCLKFEFNTDGVACISIIKKQCVEEEEQAFSKVPVSNVGSKVHLDSAALGALSEWAVDAVRFCEKCQRMTTKQPESTLAQVEQSLSPPTIAALPFEDFSLRQEG